MKINEIIKNSNELARTKDILGYHGTSIEAILILDKTGKLPDSGINKGRFCMVHPYETVGPAVWHAHQIAVRHYLEQKLPFKVPSHDHIVAVQSLVDPKLKPFRFGMYERYFDEFMEIAKNAGFGQRRIVNMIRKGYEERRGCFLIMSKKMENDFKKTHQGKEIEFLTPEGVGIEYVSVIYPLGEYERKTLEQYLGKPISE